MGRIRPDIFLDLKYQQRLAKGDMRRMPGAFSLADIVVNSDGSYKESGKALVPVPVKYIIPVHWFNAGWFNQFDVTDTQTSARVAGAGVVLKPTLQTRVQEHIGSCSPPCWGARSRCKAEADALLSSSFALEGMTAITMAVISCAGYGEANGNKLTGARFPPTARRSIVLANYSSLLMIFLEGSRSGLNKRCATGLSGCGESIWSLDHNHNTREG